MATLKDVAEYAGVTVTTVSRMLNNRCNISPKTRAKVEEAMQVLGYRPNEMARTLAKGGNSNLIGLIVPTAKNFFFSTVIERVEAYVSAAGCKLLLCISNLDEEKEHDYFNMLISNKVMGIILWNLTQNMDDIRGIDAPLIVIERKPASSIPYAVTDNYKGGCIAAQHLIDKGCKRMVFFGGNSEKNTDPNRRYDGFRDTILAAGLPEPPVFEAPWEEFINMDFDHSVKQLFMEHPNADGFLASNEIIASAIVRHCLHNGIDVPGRVKVIGYDDTPFATNTMLPLTTVHQPIDEICHYAVDNLIQRSEGKTSPMSAVFPVHLVERETT